MLEKSTLNYSTETWTADSLYFCLCYTDNLPKLNQKKQLITRLVPAVEVSPQLLRSHFSDGSKVSASPPPPSSSALTRGTGWASACLRWLSTVTFDLLPALRK
ncbi:hypothetical protein Q8A73_018076 [Channa argus]|nr:hypothetical protein Q8A73_018076 [Channa argus]